MKINYDKIADALYISLSKSKVAKTVKLKDRLIVDVDKNGNVVGVEILDASSQISKSTKPTEIKVKIPAFA